MNRLDKIIDFIDRHKYGLLATIAIHVGLFLYFQIATYKEAHIFEPWDFRLSNDEAPDDIVITADQIETPTEQDLFRPEDISSHVKSEHDERERSRDENQRYTSYSSSKDAQSIEDEYEQSLRDKIEEERASKDQSSSPKESPTKSKDKKDDLSFDFGPQASSEAISGQTMVSYSLVDRSPLNNNDWYVRNPGYTCGNVNGTVRVAITVDIGGKVIAASLIEAQSQNATTCMKQKAVEYALMSRFNYSSNAPQKQEGVITYRFVYRN